MAVPAGRTMTLEESGKPNSMVRPLIMAPSLALRLMPVQAKLGLVADANAAIRVRTATLRIMGVSGGAIAGSVSFNR